MGRISSTKIIIIIIATGIMRMILYIIHYSGHSSSTGGAGRVGYVLDLCCTAMNCTKQGDIIRGVVQCKQLYLRSCYVIADYRERAAHMYILHVNI